MHETRLNRRDILLMTSGAAALGLGRLADGVSPSSASGRPDELSPAVQRLDHIPVEFESWSSKSGEISAREQRAASIHGHVRREYQNADSGYRVGMTLLCGPAGPMAVHPPTACFEGVGYVPLSGPVVTSFARNTDVADQATFADSPRSDHFNKATFRHDTSSMPQAVRVFWAWSSDGSWSAPANPRLTFCGEPWLYKIYIIDRTVLRSGAPVLPQAESFLKDVLPLLGRTLADSHSSVKPSLHPPTA